MKQSEVCGALSALTVVKRVATLIVLTLALALSVLPSVSFAQTIRDVNECVRVGLLQAFPPSFPAAPGVPFHGQDAAFASTTMDVQQAFVAWATRADFAQFPPEQIARGLIVGAVYLPDGEAPTGERIAEGWYLVQMRSRDMTRWRATLIHAETGVRIATLRASATAVAVHIERTWNDIGIHHYHFVDQFGNTWACTEIVLTYMCPNGQILDSLVVWKRCRRIP